MSRRAAKIDGNQGDIVIALEAVGASVQSLAAVGNGCPDLLVGFRGTNFVIEVKDPAQPANKRRLNSHQKPWHAEWCEAAIAAKRSMPTRRQKPE